MTAFESGLLLWEPSVCLTSMLGESLAALDDGTLAATTVVLPTLRLRVRLLARIMTVRGRSFVPPKITTLNHLIEAWSASDLPAQKPTATELDLTLLAQQILKGGPGGSRKWRWLKDRHASELILLHKEAIELDSRLNWRERFATFERENESHSLEVLRSMLARALEAEEFFQALETAVSNNDYEFAGILDRTRCGVAQKFLQGTPEFPGPIIIAALTSATPAQKSFLAEAARHPQVALWLSDASRSLLGDSPLSDLIKAIRAPSPAEAGDSRAGASARDSSMDAKSAPLKAGLRVSTSQLIIRCRTPEEEVTTALALAQEATMRGIAPHQIGILVTSEERYAMPLLEQCALGKITHNYAIPIPWSLSSKGKWLELLARLLGGAFTPSLALALVTHPAALVILKKHLAFEGSPHELAMELSEAMGTITHAPRLVNLIRATQSPLLSSSLTWLQDLVGHWTSENTRSIEEWTKVLVATYEALPHPGDSHDLWEAHPLLPFEGPAQGCFENFTELTQQSPLIAPLRLDLDQYLEFLRKNLLSIAVHRIGEPLLGVQIVHFRESRSVPLHFAIILGCQEGYLPERLPQDEIVDHSVKPHVGLRPLSYLESLQDHNFHLLLDRVPTVHLLYNMDSSNAPTVRSRYLEWLINDGIPECEPTDLRLSAEILQNHSSKFVSDKSENSPSKVEPPPPSGEGASGLLFDLGSWPVGETSPSRMREYLHCPYRFMLGRLGVAALELPGQKAHQRSEGDLLHGILEIFWRGHSSKLKYLSHIQMPWPRDTAQLSQNDWATTALERLIQITTQVLPPDEGNMALSLQLRWRSWPRLIEHLAELRQEFPDMVSDGLWEIPFSVDWHWGSGNIEEPRRLLHLRGAIDAVLMSKEQMLIMDYKRGRAPGLSEVKHGLDPQLVCYTLATAGSRRTRGVNTHDKSVAAGYWEIGEGKWALRLNGIDDGVSPPPDKARSLTLKQAIERLEMRLTQRHRSIQKIGRMYADPSHCFYCDFAGICRRDAKDHRDRIHRQGHLRQWLIEERSHAPS